MTEIVSRYTFLVAILNAFVLKKCENCYAQLFLMDVEWGGGGFLPLLRSYQFYPCNIYKYRNWPSKHSDF